MKIRTGRRNGRNLYLQLGEEPSDADPCLGLIISPTASAVIVDVINKYEGVFSGPHRVRHAVIGVDTCCEEPQVGGPVTEVPPHFHNAACLSAGCTR